MAIIGASTILYSDINKNPVKNASSLAYNMEAIKQSLDNLFNTPYGSRSWQPTYGNTFHEILGELERSTDTRGSWIVTDSITFLNIKSIVSSFINSPSISWKVFP